MVPRSDSLPEAFENATYFDHGLVVNLFLHKMAFQIFDLDDPSVRLHQIRFGVVEAQLVGADFEDQDVAKRVAKYDFVRIQVLVVLIN